MEVNTLVKGTDTTGLKFLCARVVDIFNHLAFIKIGDQVLKCNIRDLEII